MTTPRTLLSCLGVGFTATALTTHGLAAPIIKGLAGNIAGNLATDLFWTLDRGVAELLSRKYF
jgi:hypothetical protein